MIGWGAEERHETGGRPLDELEVGGSGAALWISQKTWLPKSKTCEAHKNNCITVKKKKV